MSLGTPLPPSSPDGTPDLNGGLSDGGAAGFDGLLETAVRERTARQASPGLVLASELDPVRLCRYAGGALAGVERSETERVLARSRWAVGRVAALVRAGRASGSESELRGLARRLLQLGEAGKGSQPDAPQPEAPQPEVIVGAALLESLGCDPASPAASAAAQGPERAAGLLALGRLDEARRAFEALPPGSPLLELARRVAAPAAEPWVEVLQAL